MYWREGSIQQRGNGKKYRRLFINGEQVYEHRFVMEIILGRKLTKKEVVHHINGNGLDNRPENLGLYANSGEHLHDELTIKRPRGRPRIPKMEI